MENDASMEIRKQRGFPQAARLRRISHRPDGGNASQSTYFRAAAIHLKIGNFLSKEWGDPQASEYSGMSRGWLIEKIKAGELPAFKAGGWKIRRSDLEQL